MRLNQRGGVQDYYDIGNRLNFSSKDDYENWFKRIESFSQNIKNSLQNNKLGLDLGYTQPKLVSLAVSEQISAILEKEIDEHPYLSIFYSAQDVMPENEANLLIQRVKNLIENEIVIVVSQGEKIEAKIAKNSCIPGHCIPFLSIPFPALPFFCQM